MRTDEVALMAKVMAEEGTPKEEMMTLIESIDDMLSMQRMECVIGSQSRTATGRIRKKSSLMDFYDRRLQACVDELNEIRSQNIKTNP